MHPSATVSKAPINVKPQTDAPENKLPHVESAPVHKSTAWPGAGRMSGNLFEDRNWLLPPNYPNNDSKDATGITSPKPSIKEEPKIGEQPNIIPKTDKCGWEPNCPFCKNQDKEDWDGKHQNQLQQKTSPQPKMQRPQARCPPNPQKPDQETPDKYLSQTKICQQWKAEMESMNTKYNLDCFSDSKLDSESDEGEEYKYEHGYKALILEHYSLRISHFIVASLHFQKVTYPSFL